MKKAAYWSFTLLMCLCTGITAANLSHFAPDISSQAPVMVYAILGNISGVLAGMALVSNE